MAYNSAVLAPTNSTDALFRAWGSFISAGLLAGGLTKVWDNGADWATVSAPGSTSTYPVREVWQLTDGRADDMFIMLDYGSGTASASSPSIRYHVGSSYDAGTGAINSVNSSTLQTLNTGANTTTTYDCRVSATDDGFTFMMWTGSSSSTWLGVIVERLNEADGNGLAVGHFFGTGTRRYIVVAAPGESQPAAETNTVLVLSPAGGNANVSGTRAGVSQINFFRGPAIIPPRRWLATGNQPWTTGAVISATVNGASRSYEFLGTANTSGFTGTLIQYLWMINE